MENIPPYTLINRCLDARQDLRRHRTLEAMLRHRIAQLPEDDFCSEDVEFFQLGAGYAHLRCADTDTCDINDSKEMTATILDAFFAMRPRNRYLDEHKVLENRKLVHEAVLSRGTRTSQSTDPFEVSAATRFLEGYAIVDDFHRSNSAR